jgi:hypothetical protein
MTTAAPTLADLYHADEVAWYDAMAELIRLGRHAALDHAHLLDLLTDMGASARNEVDSRLVVLMQHVLKWLHQPDQRSRSWQLTIADQQFELAQRAGAGVLRRHALDRVADLYPQAVKRAGIETGLPASAFPADCPFTLEQLLAFDPAA